MKSATSSTPTGQHRTPWLIERTDTGPQLPRTSRPVTTTSKAADPHHLRALADTPPAPSHRPALNARLNPHQQTNSKRSAPIMTATAHETEATAQDFQDALETVLDRLEGVNAILATQ